MTKIKYGATTKTIMMQNMVTGEQIEAGRAQRFTKAALVNVLNTGNHSDFSTKAWDAMYGENDNVNITYSRKTGLHIGNALRLYFAEALNEGA